MVRLLRKRLDSPDEVRSFPHGRVEIFEIGDNIVGKTVYEPGWQWSTDVKAIAGTDLCMYHHLGYCLVGLLHVILEDGTSLEIGAGEAFEIPPGHDAWVLGDEPWDSVEFTSAHEYGLSPDELGERVLATILFSDIVASTSLLERVGDSAWAKLIREHNVRIRAAIDRYRGREIDAAGDGFLALFDGAAKAVNAAALMDPSVAELGARVRVGIHTGEVEIVGGRARGVAVHAAARVASLAGPGEVLVSGTTRDLLDGSGLSFEARGEHELKGLTGARPIFALRRA